MLNLFFLLDEGLSGRDWQLFLLLPLLGSLILAIFIKLLDLYVGSPPEEEVDHIVIVEDNLVESVDEFIDEENKMY